MEDPNPLFIGNMTPMLKVDHGLAESFKSLNTDKDVEHKEKLLYLMFENIKNNCWLDASIVLLANSKAFEDNVDGFPSSHISNIITTYKKALSILNDSKGLIQERMDKTRKMLQGIQETTLNYLKQFLKFKSGEPESAFCALLNLIYRDESKIKENMTVSWIWQKNCENCGISKFPFRKPIITLPKVNEFNPESPTCVYTCSSCKKEQEMKLIYRELPNCLIFHFEKGAGAGNNIPLSFIIDAREYHLTSVIVLEKNKNNPYLNINHFVTWIRQPSVDMWLDCNDLNTNIVQYERKQPEWQLNDLYMCVYEANDNFGKINYILADSELTQEVDAEVINLSDEGEELDEPKSTESEIATDIENEEMPLNKYPNNDVGQLKVDFYKELMDNNVEHSAFLNVSPQEMPGIEGSPNLENINIIHTNVPLTDDQHSLSEMSPGGNYETGIESQNCASESVILDVPEIHTGETHPENGTSNALNQKSEFPDIIFVDKNDTLEKSVGDLKLGAVPRNKANESAEKSKEKRNQKIEDKGNKNSNLGKKEACPTPKLSEASARGTRPRPMPSGRRRHRERPKLSEASARELENIIDSVTTNVFSNFMAFICDQHESNNSGKV